MNRIKELRQDNGWLQSDLANRLKTSRQAIGNYETGQRSPDIETILKLCEIFDCTSDYLLGKANLRSPSLTEEEEEIILAFRRGDERSRELVRLALAPFIQKATDAESAT